jgi:hypothetical protein
MKKLPKMKKIDDIKPFEHGDEGTHFACNKRIKKEGGKARCCECVPHEGCGREMIDEEFYKECIRIESLFGVPVDLPDYYKERILNFFHQKYAELLESVIPEEREVCGCDEEEDGLGYHTKDCSFRNYGWNECIEEIKSRIKKVLKIRL